jgi:hypothetical protein
MRIREVLDKRVGKKKYTKLIITLPKQDVANSNLLGKDLEITSKEGEIKLIKRKV